MTCKDCIHYEVCREWNAKFIDERLKMGNNCVCKDFKPKSRYIELPCAVGDYAKYKYNGDEAVWKIISMSFYCESQPQISLTHKKVTNTLTLSFFKDRFEIIPKEEAEQALKGGVQE